MLRARGLRERHLLDGEERPDLVPARADHADRGGDQQEGEIAGRHEHGGREDHQHRSGDERPPPAQHVGAGRQVERDGHVADQRQREEQPDAVVVDPDCRQIEHENDGDEPVGEEPDGARREQEARVAREGEAGGVQARKSDHEHGLVTVVYELRGWLWRTKANRRGAEETQRAQGSILSRRPLRDLCASAVRF